MKRKFLYLPFVFILAVFVSHTTLQAQQVFKTTSASVIGYLEYLPQGYHNNSNKYPLVIFLHGKGEKGPNSTNPSTLKSEIDEVAKLGPPYYVKKGTQFPFILISPQLKSGYGDWPSDYVMEVLNHVKKYLRVDESRIYLTGLSLGGGGTWNTAQDHPNVFAAIAPVCGSRNSTKKACNLAENKTRVWAFHGDKDNVVPLGRSLNMVNAINGCDPRPDPKAKMTVYPGIRHNAWDKAYKPDHSVHSQNVYEWLLTHRRSGSSTQKPDPAKAPDVNAGSDKEITLPTSTVTLTASVSGSTESYKWSQISGKTCTLSGATSKTLKLSGLKEGVYEFRFTAVYKDENNNKKERHDQAKVTVKKSGNTTPVANAGSDKTLTLPTNRVVLDGHGSDKDNDELTYYWKQQSGARVTMKGAHTDNLDVSDLRAGEYEFRLTVKDKHGAQHYDHARIIVKGSSNNAPVASAGSDKTVTIPDHHVVLSGKGTDKDNDPLTYYWKQQEGKRVTMKGAKTPSLDVSDLQEGTYRFRLTVKDNKGGEHYDEARITVRKGSSDSRVAETDSNSGEGAVTANAGSDRVVNLSTSTVTLHGSAESNADVISYRWTQVAGQRVKLENANSSALQISNVKTPGTRSFKLTVVDRNGKTDIDHVRITFEDAGKASSGARMAASSLDDESSLAEMPGSKELVNPDDLDLRDTKDIDWSPYKVTVYNDRGESVYSGVWDHEKYNEVMSHEGLYLYSVSDGVKRVKSGKVFVKQ